MNNLILIIKLINIFFISILIYKLLFKRRIDYLNSLFCSLVIFLSLGCTLFISSFPYNIFIFLLLIIMFMLISNMSSNVEYEKVSILIQDGKINFLELIKNKYFLKDIIKRFKECKLSKISNVDLAILDRNGKVSFYVKADNKNILLLLIFSGRVNHDSLKIINKDRKWLDSELNKRNIILSDVIYAFFSNNLLYIIKK